MHIVIRAGGKGSRLWPISTNKHPKQFQPIINGKSTFELTLKRVMPLVEQGHSLLVSVGADFVDTIKQQLDPALNTRLIIEPERRDTAAAFGLEAVYVYHANPDAVLVGAASDHVITNEVAFLNVLQAGEQFLNKNPEQVVCIGVQPTYPEPGLGYIEMGEKLESVSLEVDGESGSNQPVHTVVRFKEKPDVETAKKFLAQGNYVWNANYFMWKARHILELYKKLQPAMYKHLMAIEQAIDTPQEHEVIAREYPQMEKVAAEYAIIEKVEHMVVLPVDMGWTDIGSFVALRDLRKRGDENVVEGTVHVGLDTTRSFIYGDGKRLIATIGLDNIAVVESGDALLVCPLDKVQRIKELVATLEEKELDQYL